MVDITLSSVVGGSQPPTSLVGGTVDSTLDANAGSVIGAINVSTTSASTQTALDITSSSGVVEYVGIQVPVVPTALLLKITIDGVIVYNDTTPTIGINDGRNAIGSVYFDSTNAAGVSLANIPFRQSLKIEYAADGTQTVNCSYRYYLT